MFVEHKKPVGIFTDFDATLFFRNNTEGLILIQDIEITLRQYIESVLQDEQAMQAALMVAFGADKIIPQANRQENMISYRGWLYTANYYG